MRLLVERGYAEKEYTRAALLEVPRELFVEAPLAKAYLDKPLPIGNAQTVSAPHMVALFTDNLGLESGDRVLEVGTGCGYHAAVTAAALRFLGGGMVYTVEVDRMLYACASQNLARAGYLDKVSLHLGDGVEGLSSEAPFDSAYFTTALQEKPVRVMNQVKEGGTMIYPYGLPGEVQDLVRARKVGGAWSQEKIVDCVFVPVRRPGRGFPGFSPN